MIRIQVCWTEMIFYRLWDHMESDIDKKAGILQPKYDLSSCVERVCKMRQQF